MIGGFMISSPTPQLSAFSREHSCDRDPSRSRRMIRPGCPVEAILLAAEAQSHSVSAAFATLLSTLASARKR